MAQTVDYIQIHEYGKNHETGLYHLDDDGDPKIGFYFELIDTDDDTITGEMGPYSTFEEASHHAQLEANRIS